MSIKNDGHYFCRAGGNRPDGLNEPVTLIWHFVLLEILLAADACLFTAFY
ncbi:copper resistance protein [Salmonella enterica]|nr:copper resistance protein [Salmonella enterica]